MTQFLEDIFHPSKAYERKRNEFIKQYKKKYEELTATEKVMVDAHFQLEFLRIESQELRFLGAVEAVLIAEKIINPGQPYNIHSNIFTNLSRYSYREYILTQLNRYLKNKNIL